MNRKLRPSSGRRDSLRTAKPVFRRKIESMAHRFECLECEFGTDTRQQMRDHVAVSHGNSAYPKAGYIQKKDFGLKHTQGSHLGGRKFDSIMV